MVAIIESEFLERSAEGWVRLSVTVYGMHPSITGNLTSSAGASKTESKDSHRHGPTTLAAVNVSVGGEDVGNWLWSVWLVCVGHCEGGWWVGD